MVQLCEVAQAGGGYGYSFGIEELARRGRLRSPEQLTTMIRGVLLASVGPADGVASGIVFRAARQGSFEELADVSAAMSSDRVPVGMRLASLQMGERLWGLSRDWDWARGIHQELDGLAGESRMHHAVAFGALVSETTSSQVRAIATYLLNVARGMILTAVRMIPLDEITGQRILASVQPTITELAAACADKQPEDIAALGPYGDRGRGGEDPLRELFP
jgi:urease accessory protein